MRGRWGWQWLAALGLVLGLAGCGGGTAPEEAPSSAPSTTPGAASGEQVVLHAQASPRVKAKAAGDATSLTIHYKRSGGDYSGWQVHHWGAAASVDWNAGRNADSFDDFGAVYNIPLASPTGAVGYLFHRFDDKDGGDNSYTLQPGSNEIWRIQGDPITYTSKPGGPVVPDIDTVRVHYKRYGADYANWGLHLWASNGIDVGRIPAGVVIDRWPEAVGFDRMPGYAAGSGEVVFDIPVLNPKADSSRSRLEFIIHGKAPNENDKDGRNDNITVVYGNLKIKDRVGEIWMVQGDATVYTAPPDLRRVSTTDARAFWLNSQLIQWPVNDGVGVTKLYHSATASVSVGLDQVVSGADGSITLESFSGAVPAAAAERFKWIAAGARFKVPDSAAAQLKRVLKSQVVLVQEDAAGRVQNATTVQLPGALDELYAAADGVNDLGLSFDGRITNFKLWAPTAQRVRVLINRPDGTAFSALNMGEDPATGVWRASLPREWTGYTYVYEVTTFVRGVGIVRNLVTDPYSISLTANSLRSWIGSLNSPALKPAGWDASSPPAKVQAAPDMSIYELHVRDFSVNDASVSMANRGKYLAFTESGSNGMKHLKGLADAGLTDVHLLPVFDIASVNELGCTSPTVPAASPDSEAQQAAVSATAGQDCFNWGYDPLHFNAAEGSYASSAADGAKRVIELRAMVKALHDAGLRVGMDVVYNHTTSSGQNANAVLDRIVPGYYHRYNAQGGIERSTCCENTATENLMMAKLMTDSVILWAREYKISSFRFDIMGHQPRPVMEAMKAKLKTAVGRDVQLLGEGWNFGEVANGARFVQATLYSLPGSGIGSFNPWIRDAVRGGGPFTGGNGLVGEQGWINGLWYDPNALAPAVGKNELMWRGDLIKAALAGSIKSYPLTTHWDANLTLDQLDAANGGAGYVLEPSEAVNYVENHDNQTLFDNNVFKLPMGTSTADRARVQILGAAIVALSQGTAYYHAGVETLRSKSLDRNSYDAGDWFNRLDWTLTDNYFGTGLPRKSDNGDNWSLMRPFLANTSSIKPTSADITWTRDAFRDLLRIRASTSLLRMKTAADIKSRLKFHNTGSTQEATVIVGAVDGAGYAGANFAEVVYLINADKTAKALTIDALKAKGYSLHPVHRAPGAADQRVSTQAAYDNLTGRFTVPARSAVVFVR